MKIGFIGAGKVGCSLGRYFAQNHTVVGYVSKHSTSAEEAASLTDSNAFSSIDSLIAECEVVFITTPDGEIVSTWEKIRTSTAENALSGKILCHCSGALPSTAFEGHKKLGAFAYSVHPLFAIPSKTTNIEELSRAFFAIEGDREKLNEVASFIEKLGNPYQIINTNEKVRYHAAAALASNHVIALYRISCNELVKCGFSPKNAEKALAPLFLGNAQHVAESGTIASLTGPAERGDFATIEKHLACLDGSTREVYRILNETLLQIAEEKRRIAK